VAQKEQVLSAGLEIVAIDAVLTENRDLSGSFTFDCLVNVHQEVGALKGVPGLWHLA
jgi:hypothetical protein